MTDEELCGYVRQYHGMLVRLAFSYMKNREDAEDVAQDTFIRLYRCDKVFMDDGNVKAWLIRVASNLCKDMLRSCAYRHRGEQLDDIPCESAEELGLLDCVKRLKPQYAAAVYLYYYEGYSVKELAKVLGITATAASTRLARARSQLKKMLLKEGLYDERQT